MIKTAMLVIIGGTFIHKYMAYLRTNRVLRNFFASFAVLFLGALLLFPSQAFAGTRGKSAFNETQNVNAESRPSVAGDVIAYTLSYFNNGSISENIGFEDDLTDVLYSADLLDSGGGSLWGSALRFPAVSVPSNTRVDRVFRVKVKNLPANTLDTLMSNTFGNGVDVRLQVSGAGSSGEVKGAYTAPQTGPSEWAAAIFACLAVLGYYLIRRRRLALKSA